MSNQEEALNAWQDVMGSLQPRAVLRRGLVGDGAGHVEVTGLPGWIWIRYEEELNRLSTVRCFIGYLEEGTPVIVGKWHPEEDYEQVLGISWGLYSVGLTNYVYTFNKVPQHGETHHGTVGSDPAWIDYANFVFGRVSPTNPDTMIVDIGSFVYPDGPEVKDYDGGTLDLTSEVPGAGHKYVLVYFDLDAEEIDYTESATVALPVSPSMPALENVNAIPLGLVRLYAGQTEITIDDTWQRKLMLGHTGGARQILQQAIVHEGDVVTHNGEIVWAI